ncbi:MAG: glycoside hydrolase family 15 protein [Agriterribacter sp.]
MQKHVYNTGLIGNCSYLAQVSKTTDIVWLCWPRFDSPFVFGSLLDNDKGGHFSVLPPGEYKSRQFYRENTNVLCTEITTSEGRYRVTDFAPRFMQQSQAYRPSILIRKVELLEGLPRVTVVCQPVGDYGRKQLTPVAGNNAIEFNGDDQRLYLHSNIPISFITDAVSFVLTETKYLVLSYGKPFELPLAETAEQYLLDTIAYWQRWIRHTTIASFHQQHVIRSALVLKIHQYEDTGAIIAASTTSLPEFPGSGRNWDYRYCWLRDTYYVLAALGHIGHFEEMENYFNYVTGIAFSEEGRFQPLYGITGQKELTENIFDHLQGYQGNQPVRVGNQAYEHIQNDIYGQALISLLPLYTDHRFIFSERGDSARWIAWILNKIEATINEEDAGIWEFRHMANLHCYSNLFQWAGCCAAEKMANTIGDSGLALRAAGLKKQAADNIEKCYDPGRGVYTNAVKGTHLDASTLQLIMMHYLDPASDRARQHLDALEKELKTPKGLFYRYIHGDDFGKPKATFLICAFWYVEALACVGKLDQAIKEFENLLQYGNDLLLFSEDVDEATGSQWGNFPQAYSHVGLMNAAYRIAMRLDQPIFLSHWQR